MTQQNASNDGQQLQLDITAPDEPLTPVIATHAQQSLPIAPVDPHSAGSKETVSQSRDSGYIRGITLVASVVLLLVIASQQRADPAPERPANFAAATLSPVPEVGRTFVEIPFNDAGEILQLGLFRQLSGAETQQAELARIGILPHIEKRVNAGETKYAVMLGPLDTKAHEGALAILDKHNVTYFHARGPVHRLANGKNSMRIDAQGS